MYNCIEDATRLARHLKHMYVTPEHVLYALSMNDNFVSAFRSCGGSIQELKGSIRNYFSTYLKTSEYKGDPDLSASMKKALEIASRYAKGSNRDDVGIADIMYGISQSSESYACYYIAIQHVDCDELIYKLQNPIEDKNEESEEEDDSNTSDNTLDKKGIIELLRKQLGIPEGVAFTVEGPITGLFPPFLPFKGGTGNNMGDATGSRGTANSDGNDVEDWKKLVTNLNEAVKSRKEPLVGREDIIERTIQILCRKYKSNVIHIGEPGVGKTAITMGLARQINEGNVPEQLQGATIYSIDMGSLLAGTMFRGQFEQRIEAIMNGLEQEEKPIAYIDEIHTIIGAGASSDGAIDASNMIKRRLTEGKIRFIGSTTYEEYKKYIEKDKALNRRFKAIEVREASVAETIEILNGIKKCYEGYHNVVFTGDAIKSAAELFEWDISIYINKYGSIICRQVYK